MSSLFGITQEYLSVLENLEVDEFGEIQNLEELTTIKDSFETKATNMALFVQQLESDIEGLKKKESELKDRRLAKQNKVDSLRAYLANSMLAVGKTDIETDLVRLSFRRSEVVEVSEDFDLEEFMQVKTTITPDKAKIKAAIKSGQGPEGAILVEKQNLQIK